MIELTEQPSMSWWALIRGKLAACWWRLLVVQLVIAAAGLAILGPPAALIASGMGTAAQLWLFATGDLVVAWGWSAMLRILGGGHGVASALRPDARRIGRLWGWLTALNIMGLPDLLASVDSSAFAAVALSPALAAVQLVSLYLSFAAALLPMAILLEGRGIRRAWRLSHASGWRTALRVLAVVVAGYLLTSAMQQLQAGAMGVYPPSPQFLPVQLATLVVNTLKATLTPVLLYAVYRLSPLCPVRAENDRSPAAGAAEAAPAGLQQS